MDFTDGLSVLPAFLTGIPRDWARHHAVAAVTGGTGVEVIAGTETPVWIPGNVAVALGLGKVTVRHGSAEAVRLLLDRAYESAAPASAVEANVDAAEASGEALSLDHLLEQAEKDLLSTSGKAPVVRLVDGLLFEAVQQGASDLHLQPHVDHIVVRLRVDGVLDQGRHLPLRLLRPMVSRIKVMGGMDVAEHLLPQDGRTTVRIGSRACDIRISTLPTPHGERVVLRVLDASRQLQTFPELGMPLGIATPYLAAARRSSGIVLVTGPTGSGKTTTLYATLRELDNRERNIMTIEDPIEYELDTLGLPISQSQVNLRKGVTFANGLRHILRQDPDVILVGEIRDAETARIAIQASLTGHLVFSTLHTNDAPSAVTRLLDLGVEPYLVAASLSAVLAQRLIRVRCRVCLGSPTTVSTCTACGGSGFRGRQGVFEVLALDDGLREAIGRGASLQELHRIAVSGGMMTLRQHGAELVANGVTSAAEVERVIHG